MKKQNKTKITKLRYF